MMMMSCSYGNTNDDDVMLVWYIYCVKFIYFSFYRSFSCFSEEWLAAVVVGKERVTCVSSV